MSPQYVFSLAAKSNKPNLSNDRYVHGGLWPEGIDQNTDSAKALIVWTRTLNSVIVLILKTPLQFPLYEVPPPQGWEADSC